VEENRNIVERLKEERDDFYENKREVTGEEMRWLRRELSLGGAVIESGRLRKYVSEMVDKNKSEKVNEWVGELLLHVKELELSISIRPLYEQRMTILRYLNGCLWGRPEQAFETRSKIIEAIFPRMKDEENLQQERTIERMKEIVKNVQSKNVENKKYLMKYSKKVRSDYADYLLGRIDEFYKL